MMHSHEPNIEKQIVTDSQFEYVSTQWYSRWSNGWPPIVTPRLFMCVKSDAASRPG